MKRGLLCFVVLLLGSVGGFAGEPGFLEDFALAQEREKALEQLIPGTEEYYYFHALHYQNTGRFEKMREILDAWIKKRGYTGGVHEILNRQALIDYPRKPRESLDYLRKKLNLHFNHQRIVRGKKTDYPTTLDPKTVSQDAFLAEALRRHQNLQGFTDAGLALMMGRKMSEKELRHLLSRLERPDWPDLPRLIVEDLRNKHSGGFGSHKIHRLLTKAQLEELMRLMPELRNHNTAIQLYLQRLQPGPEDDWRRDPRVRQAYLERLWNFVEDLPPAQNSLKAHVLYQRLVHDREQGTYDKQRFLDYLKLPRSVHYINPDWIRPPERRHHRANLGANFRQQTLLPPVHHDEPLVREYLAHFFVQEQSAKDFAPYIEKQYLDTLYAETMLLNGIGDKDEWSAKLTPTGYQRLRDRIDIDFAPTNPKVFGADEAVELDLFVKNVETLIVNVYAINAESYYRDNLDEIPLDINLEGLVANRSRTEKYDEPAVRRIERRFAFPELKERGTYVLEFIGGGLRSRALVRKGTLRTLERTGAAGHVFTVLDDKDNVVETASLYIAGHEYEADGNGRIHVPYSTKPGRQPMVILDRGLAVLDHFDHKAENYRLVAGVYVDREALLTRKTAKVLLRPVVYINDQPVPRAVLEEVKLTLTAVDRDGIPTTQEIPGFALPATGEAVHEFQVPERLLHLNVSLSAKVENLTKGGKQSLADGARFTVNALEQSARIEDLQLSRTTEGYILRLLGKTGEPKADQPVNLTFKHELFTQTRHATLQTDAGGEIRLGQLDGLAWMRAQSPGGNRQSWSFGGDACEYVGAVHTRAGAPILVPYVGAAQKPTRAALALLRVNNGANIADLFEKLTLEDGYVRIDGLEAGDYELALKEAGRSIAIRVSGGEVRAGYLVGKTRMLQIDDITPLQIAEVARDDTNLMIRLRNANDLTRVHLIATRFMPTFSAFAHLSKPGRPGPRGATLQPAESLYEAGSAVSDEFRYILDRKYAKKYPGVMLDRPELLLNPWAVRETETGTAEGREGGAFGHRSGAGRRGMLRRGDGGRHAEGIGQSGHFSYDFLPAQSGTRYNLKPDKDGIVSVPLKDLHGKPHVHVVAVDPRNTVYRQAALPETPFKTLDLRLRDGLDPAKHFTEQKLITVVTDQPFTVDDIATSQVEVYDSLAKAYRLYATLRPNPKLAEFAFVLNWPKLKPEEKREKYSEYACHELNLFLFHKDKEFFQAVIKPYLAHKKDKTFVDRWLLGEDLGAYRAPWAFGRLNTVEKILLSRRVAEERAAVERYVREEWELLPPNVALFNHLFNTAIKGNQLAGGGYGVEKKAKEKFDLITRSAEPKQREESPAEPGFDAAAPSPMMESEAEEAEALARGAQERRRKAAATGRVLREDGDALRDRARRALQEGEKRLEEMSELDEADIPLGGKDKSEMTERRAIRRFFRQLPKTKEWAENNYYNLPIHAQVAELVPVNAFWADYAATAPGKPFYSEAIAECGRNFPEMMLALSVLDLPFDSGKHETKLQERKLTIEPATPFVAFHKEIRPAQEPEQKAEPILVSQQYFDQDDRYRHEGNQKVEKYVEDEFVVHNVYGCQVILTNPTARTRKLDALLQVPRGAVPVQNGFQTRGVPVELQPYGTQKIEYYFYFPLPGEFAHYPVHVARDGALVAFDQASTLKVVSEPTQIDEGSWDYISQDGTLAQVVQFIETHNLGRVELAKIAWRLREKAAFEKIVPLLRARHAYDQTLWSYGLLHDDKETIREFLAHAEGFVRQCGDYLETELLIIDPVARHWYEHLEYDPLVNARAHRFGGERKILNRRFFQQYMQLMKLLSYKAELGDDELMAATYYLLLQDRFEKALAFFARVQPQKLETRLQYDYFDVYLDFVRARPDHARTVAQQYADYPVDRWRNRFALVLQQLDEVEGRAAKTVDEEDRDQQQAKLAATEPALDMTVEAKTVNLTYQNLEEVTVNYYLMDIELLFSQNPFMQEQSGRFDYIEPNRTETVKLPAAKRHSFKLPDAYQAANVLVEVKAGALRKSQAYYANELNLQLIENYGQVRVTHAQDGKPLPKVYVKVYAKQQDGRVKFYKDGYTDLRGRFDYASLSTDDLNQTVRFAILVLSEKHGALIREAQPPKQ